MSQAVARLVSVNVGQPREITWRGRTVFTGIWKEPVDGPRTVRRLNVDGDGQGDLNGHGGEHRAVYVYQLDSYRYWQDQMHRDDFVVRPVRRELHGRGTRRRRGVHRRPVPHRLGAVRGQPTTGHLLPGRDPDGRAAHGRAARGSTVDPGFYLRVLEEGDVEAGDDVVKIAPGPEAMTVADVNALLYLAGHHDVDQLRRALRIPALSPGWQASLQALLDEELAGPPGGGNAGLTARESTAGVARLPHAAGHGQASRDQRRRVARAGVGRRSAAGAGAARPVRHARSSGRRRGSSPLVRSYSLSGSPGDAHYRIGVKVEPHGAAGHYIGTGVRGRRPGRGRCSTRIVHPRRHRASPVVLVSAGVGVTPMLAMLHALHDRDSTREIWWLHGARNRAEHAFADEAAVAPRRPGARAPSRLVQPARTDRPRRHGLRRGRPPHAGGPRGRGRPASTATSTCADRPRSWTSFVTRWSRSVFRPIACARRSSAPTRRSHPGSSHVRRDRRTNPRAHRAPDHSSRSCAPGSTCAGAKGSGSILELAEACDVPVRWSCRTGVCHTCETGLLDGGVDYVLEPLEAPADGNVLICCSRPAAISRFDL